MPSHRLLDTRRRRSRGRSVLYLLWLRLQLAIISELPARERRLRDPGLEKHWRYTERYLGHHSFPDDRRGDSVEALYFGGELIDGLREV